MLRDSLAGTCIKVLSNGIRWMHLLGERLEKPDRRNQIKYLYNFGEVTSQFKPLETVTQTVLHNATLTSPFPGRFV